MPLIDEPNTSFGEKAALNTQRLTLYDPPVDGLTPLDGAGQPRSSVIPATSLAAKLALGFTREPVVPEPEVEEKPRRRAAK